MNELHRSGLRERNKSILKPPTNLFNLRKKFENAKPESPENIYTENSNSILLSFWVILV